MTRRLPAALVAAACLAVAACDKSPKTPKGNSGNGDNPTPETTNVGGPLWKYDDYRPARAEGRSADDPITVPQANVVITRKLDLASRVDGTVLWIGQPIDEAAAKRMADDPKTSGDVFQHPRDKKWYRRLLPGDLVKRDQVIAFLDDEQAFLEYKGANTKADAAKKSAVAYKDTVTQLNLIVVQERDGVDRGIVPKQELYNSLATLARYQAEQVEHDGSAAVAEADAEKAKYIWEKHSLRPPIEGEVQQVLKHEGEGIKATEPVLVVHDIGKLRAIGNLPKEYVNAVGKGDPVTLEVPRDYPARATFVQHTTNKPIVAVAVGVANGKPVVVSAGEDGRVYAWDRDRNLLGSWRQPNGVRSLAVTRPEAGSPLALVGGVNGTATVYDLADPKAKGREFEGRHDGGVAAAAFSPDGKYCVTADERAIYMYETASGKRKYTFPTREHNSPVTSLSFTPQGRVVSAGREPSILVWVAGQDGAKVEHRIDSRSGDVTMPGVTDDGSRLLLDADKSHLDVIHLQEMRKERPLVTAGEAVRFTTFTAWSPEVDKKPDNRLIATTGGVEGVVQLWRAPTGENRGAEVARFVTHNNAAATCAAFNPQGENGFLVVGDRKGEVHLWPLPNETEAKTVIHTTVTHVENNIDSSGRTVNVLVDFDNEKLGDKYLLRPGSAVTLVIRPKK
jgi:WD40 repeat protein